MKNKTVQIAETTGVLGLVMGAILVPTASLSAQQRTVQNADYQVSAPSATPNKAETQCDTDKPAASNASSKSGNSAAVLRNIDWNGAGGPRDGGPRDGARGDGPMGRPPGPPQGGGRPEDDGKLRGPMLDFALEQLNLTGEQSEKINKVLEFEREKMDALHEQAMKIQTQTRANVDALLTPQQRQQLAQQETQMAAQPGGRGGPRGEGGPRGGRPGGPEGGRGGPEGGRGGPGGRRGR